MSGGSFNYLFCKDVGDLFEHEQELEGMADALAAMGGAEDAARATVDVLVEIRKARARIGARLDDLCLVWKAVEWWRSGDWGEDDVRAKLDQWRSQ